MRIFILSLVVTMCVISANADKLYINDFSIKAGETITIELLLDNTTTYKSLQCDFDLPDGLSVVCDDNGNPVFGASERTVAHIIRGSYPAGNGINHLRIGMIATGAPIAGNSGAVATIEVSACNDFSGKYTIELTEIHAGDENYIDYDLGNSSCAVTGLLMTTISEIGIDDTKASQRYNVLGQPIYENYRGIVVEKGQKRVIR